MSRIKLHKMNLPDFQLPDNLGRTDVIEKSSECIGGFFGYLGEREERKKEEEKTRQVRIISDVKKREIEIAGEIEIKKLTNEIAKNIEANNLKKEKMGYIVDFFEKVSDKLESEDNICKLYEKTIKEIAEI